MRPPPSTPFPAPALPVLPIFQSISSVYAFGAEGIFSRKASHGEWGGGHQAFPYNRAAGPAIRRRGRPRRRRRGVARQLHRRGEGDGVHRDPAAGVLAFSGRRSSAGGCLAGSKLAGFFKKINKLPNKTSCRLSAKNAKVDPPHPIRPPLELSEGESPPTGCFLRGEMGFLSSGVFYVLKFVVLRHFLVILEKCTFLTYFAPPTGWLFQFAIFFGKYRKI